MSARRCFCSWRSVAPMEELAGRSRPSNADIDYAAATWHERVKEQLCALEDALMSDGEAVSLSREVGPAFKRDLEGAGVSAEDACAVM